MLTIISLVVIFIASFWYVAVRPYNYWTKRGVKQGNPSWLFGHSLLLMLKKESFADYMERVYKQCRKARYSGLYTFTVPTLLIRDPELIKQITVKDFDHFVDHRTVVPEHNDSLWGKNLFALRGDRWKEMRPILSPQFTSSKMKSIFLFMTNCVEVFLDNLSKKGEGMMEVNMRDIFGRLGTDVIASVAFGVQVDSMSQPKNEFYRMGKEATDFSGSGMKIRFFGYPIIPMIFEIFRIRLFSKRVSNFFTKVVEETIRLREDKGVTRNDLIQLLLEARKNDKCQNIPDPTTKVLESSLGQDTNRKSKNITNADIASQSMIFFFAGFDTTANFLCFITYELAINPKIQERLRQEIMETRRECSNELTYDTLMGMKYLDMVVSETLRKWPQGVQLDRICVKPYIIPPKYPDEKPVRLEVGDTVSISVYGIHRDPKYYPNPDKFDPERFNNENKSKINSYAFIPFGTGPRNCIGFRFALLEAKIVLFHLLTNYEIVTTENTTIPAETAKSTFILILEGEFHLGLKPYTTT